MLLEFAQIGIRRLNMRKLFVYLIYYLCFYLCFFAVLYTTAYAGEPRTTRIKTSLTSEKTSQEIEEIKKTIPHSTPIRRQFQFPDFSVSVFIWHRVGTHIIVAVLTESGEIVYQKRVFNIFPENTDLFVSQYRQGVVVAYHSRVIRGAGSAWIWGEVYWIDYFTQNKETSLIIPGRDEIGGWGIPKAAHNFFMGQYPELSIVDDRIEVKYVFRHWTYTGDYTNNQFLSTVAPDTIYARTMVIEIDKRSELFIAPDSTTTTGSLYDELSLVYSNRYKTLPWKDVVHY
jgi:hypothetical protein